MVSARMLDIKMGNVTAVGGWQGKGNMKAFVQSPGCNRFDIRLGLFGLAFCHFKPPISRKEHYRGLEHELCWRRLPLAPQAGKPSGAGALEETLSVGIRPARPCRDQSCHGESSSDVVPCKAIPLQ